MDLKVLFNISQLCSNLLRHDENKYKTSKNTSQKIHDRKDKKLRGSAKVPTSMDEGDSVPLRRRKEIIIALSTLLSSLLRTLYHKD